eukprot:2104741-Prymnesium_polylepis.2
MPKRTREAIGDAPGNVDIVSGSGGGTPAAAAEPVHPMWAETLARGYVEQVFGSGKLEKRVRGDCADCKKAFWNQDAYLAYSNGKGKSCEMRSACFCFEHSTTEKALFKEVRAFIDNKPAAERPPTGVSTDAFNRLIKRAIQEFVARNIGIYPLGQPRARAGAQGTQGAAFVALYSFNVAEAKYCPVDNYGHFCKDKAFQHTNVYMGLS